MGGEDDDGGGPSIPNGDTAGATVAVPGHRAARTAAKTVVEIGASDEKKRKRLLNKHLKQRNKLRKYETRMQQAIIRKDKALEERSKKDWEEYTQRLKDDPNSVLNYSVPPSEHNNTSAVGVGGNNDAGDRSNLRSRCCQLHQASRFRHLHQSPRSSEERETKRVREGSARLLGFWKKLSPRIVSSISPSAVSSVPTIKHRTKKDHDDLLPASLTTKQRQTIHAARLKANMQAGTQTASMFRDELALLGYTRQKFYERAVLALTSLDRLDPCYRCEGRGGGDGIDDNNAGDDTDTSSRGKTNTSNDGSTITSPGESRGEAPDNRVESDKQTMFVVWERLMSTKQLVSIGCGPGCDAVGILEFLESHGVRLSNGILLMDYVIDSWKALVLEKLIPLVVPSRVPFVETVVCDVRDSLLQEKATAADDDGAGSGAGDATSRRQTNNNAAAAALLDHSGGFMGSTNNNNNNRLVVVSYLLTETRYKWKSFFRDLLVCLRGTESLLLLTEPMAWQLHEFLRVFSSTSVGGAGGEGNSTNDLLKAHVWLDSSRDLPHLQTLDKRNGPAILLVCTH